MKPIAEFPEKQKHGIRYILTDIDDTLTYKGKLVPGVITALEKLQVAGLRVIPVTGRPAGWCDHFARMWPIDGLVGENGAFYFRYDHANQKMIRRYFKDAVERRRDKEALAVLEQRILSEIPGARVSADQAYRDADLAIDFCEDVPRLPKEQIHRIVELFEESGAQAKISSIHVNGWFGSYDKLTMTRLLFQEVFQADLTRIRNQVLFIGDSPNDAPMFHFFEHSVGVANIKAFVEEISALPAWVTSREGGQGFIEMSEMLLR